MAGNSTQWLTPVSFQLYQSSSASPTFNFLNALSLCGVNTNFSGAPELHAPYLILYDNGCDQMDCTAACEDPNQIFGNPYTLANCMTLIAMGTILPPNGSTDWVSPETLHIAEDFSVMLEDRGFRDLATTMNEAIGGCVSQYCATTQGCLSYSPLSCLDVLFSDEYTIFDICSNLVVPLNADIGGIGVRSYPPSPASDCFTEIDLGIHIVLDAEWYSLVSIFNAEDL